MQHMGRCFIAHAQTEYAGMHLQPVPGLLSPTFLYNAVWKPRSQATLSLVQLGACGDFVATASRSPVNRKNEGNCDGISKTNGIDRWYDH